MSKTYTPGPWKAVMESVVSDNHYICDCNTTKDYNNINSIDAANARLIAAAPDLLEALEEVENWHNQGGLFPILKIRAAIAKAKGETS